MQSMDRTSTIPRRAKNAKAPGEATSNKREGPKHPVTSCSTDSRTMDSIGNAGSNSMDIFAGRARASPEYNGLFGYQQQWHELVAANKRENSASNSSSSNNSEFLTTLPPHTLPTGTYLPSMSSATDPNGDGASNYSSTSLLSDQSDNDTSQDMGRMGDHEAPPKKQRNPIPVEKKDRKYWERRRKNNIAAKRSRDSKRKKVEDELVKARSAIEENARLKQEVEVLKAEINSLRRLLKDANMTLSLWIRARQASETSPQLPPMLRNPSTMPFVTFPVTSSGTAMH